MSHYYLNGLRIAPPALAPYAIETATAEYSAVRVAAIRALFPQSPPAVEEVTAGTLDSLAEIHAEAFRTEAQRKPINRASFAGLIAGEHAKGFLVLINAKPAAGAIVYFASNGIAYLGTSATRRAARGQGCHSALIGCRIMAARQHGSQFVAATAMPKSQSRRNLERLGLVASHLRALYRPQPIQGYRNGTDLG